MSNSANPAPEPLLRSHVCNAILRGTIYGQEEPESINEDFGSSNLRSANVCFQEITLGLKANPLTAGNISPGSMFFDSSEPLTHWNL